MRHAFAAFFNFITTLCSALNRGASALDHLGRFAEEEAAVLADTAAEERTAKIAALRQARTKAAA